jgi:hypothetical protein
VAVYDYDESSLTLTWNPEPAARGYHVQFRSYDTWQEYIITGYEQDTDEFGNPSMWGQHAVWEWVTRSGWSEWNDLGEHQDPIRTFTVPRRTVEYRVRGLSDDITGLWITRQVDCSRRMPEAPELTLAFPYIGGELSLSWEAVTAEDITISLRSSGIERFTKKIPGSSTSASITAEEMQQRGGPWRMLEVSAIARNGNWEARSLTLEVADAPPVAVQGLEVMTEDDVALLVWQETTGNDVTGYIVGHRDTFGEVRRFETEDTSMDIPMDVGSHMFVVAAKDVLFDLIADVAVLNFSAPVEVEVQV